MFNFCKNVIKPTLVVSLSLFVFSGCGQNEKGDRNSNSSSANSSSSTQSSSSSSVANQDPFATRVAARKKEAISLGIDLATAQSLIASQTLPDDNVVTYRTTFEYDSLNRISYQEGRPYPIDETSALPAEGFVSLTIDFAYDATIPWQSDSVTMNIWNYWVEAESRVLNQTTTWTDRLWVDNSLIESSEAVTYYNEFIEPGYIESTELKDSTNTVNDAGYQTGTVTMMNGEQISSSTKIRSMDGVQLDREVTDGYVTDYSYSSGGRLEGFVKTFSSNDNYNEVTYHYATFNDEYYILIQTESFDSAGLPIGSSLSLNIYEQATCNKSAFVRAAFLIPEYWDCMELSYWSE